MELVCGQQYFRPMCCTAPVEVFRTLIADGRCCRQSLLTTILPTLDRIVAAAIGGTSLLALLSTISKWLKIRCFPYAV